VEWDRALRKNDAQLETAAKRREVAREGVDPGVRLVLDMRDGPLRRGELASELHLREAALTAKVSDGFASGIA
jgi:hypothetical protein